MDGFAGGDGSCWGDSVVKEFEGNGRGGNTD